IEAADRRARLDLQQAPLMRAALLRLAPLRYRLLLTQHHLLGDGWSAAILIEELLAFYRHASPALPPAPTFSDYLAWLMRQDRDAARQAWRAYLGDVDGPTRVARASVSDAPQAQSHHDEWLSDDLSADLERLAREHGLTLATVVQTAWAILLS